MGAVLQKLGFGGDEGGGDAAVKRQAEGLSNPMYQLANLMGQGLLVDLSKKAMITQNYKELDDTIRMKIPQYLYNGGQGKWIHCVHLACLRNRDRPPSKQFPEIQALGDAAFDFQFEDSELLDTMIGDDTYEKFPEKYTQHCWLVECRGCVGETVFHVCFLMGTPIHMHLAKRLLKHYPLLLNDIYLSEEYYGENVLHMSAVAEDPSIVKWLLDIGSDFHRRCYGNFFTCDDQKGSRRDNKTYEETDICLVTNYEGYVAWGEYPFAFAACLEQEECYRLMLSKGANHDLQDINGCTVAHVLVVFNLMRMWDMVVECGAAINIENRAGLTPLTLAAYLARMDMFFHIASVEREVYWQLGNVTCSAYPLEYLDTIHSDTGELQTKSALNLIVFGPHLEHLDLIEYVIVDLLKAKWDSYIKKSFFRQFFAFTIYFMFSTIAFTLRHNQVVDQPCGLNSTLNDTMNLTTLSYNDTLITPDLFSLTSLDPGEDMFSASMDLINSSFIGLNDSFINGSLLNTTISANATEEAEDEEEEEEEEEMCPIPEEELDMCHLQAYDTVVKKIRIGCELVILVWSIIYLAIAIRERSFLGGTIFFENMQLCPSRVLFLIACALVVLCVPMRLFCFCNAEDSLAIVIMTWTGPYFLFFCRGFKLVGPMVIMVYRMLAQDIVRFGSVFFIFVMGFSQGYYVLFQSFDTSEGDAHPMPNSVESILAVFLMSLGDVGFIWEGVSNTNHEIIGKIHFFIFIAIVVILLLNLLIAMMGDTYAKIAEIKNEWMRQWARTVLIVERGIPPAERLRQQDLYSERNSSDKKCLVMKQFLSADQLDEIEEIIEMKITHRKNIDRRRERFGYESVSQMGIAVAGADVIQDSDEENPFGDDVGGNVKSFNDMDPAQMAQGRAKGDVPF